MKQPSAPYGPTVGRHPGDLGRSLAAAAIFAACAWAAGRGLVRVEADIFRVFNNLPGWLAIVMLPVLQLGSAVAVAVASGIAFLMTRIRLGLKLAAGGAAAWLLAHAIAGLIDRPMPSVLLDDALVRGGTPDGGSFPSSHVAVAAAMAMVAMPYLMPKLRRYVWWGVTLVAAAAMYAGRALPLDVIGGAALGWWEGALLHALWGAPGRKASPQLVHDALVAAGLEPVEIDHGEGRPWGAIEYAITTSTGDRMKARIQRRGRRSAGLVYKGRRFLASIESLDEPEFATPKHAVEHEGYVSLLAERAGVRTPHVALARELDGGPGVIVRSAVDGRKLSALREHEIDDHLLEELWQLVIALRQGRIAHHDLTPDRILVDDKGDPWIVDFGQARAGATPGRLAQDVAEMLLCIASVTETERAVESGLKALGSEPLAEALLYLQPLALPKRVRRQLRGRPDLLAEARAVVADRTGAEPPTFKARIRPTTILSLAVLGGAIYILLPQIANFDELMAAVMRADWTWLGVALVFAALTFPSAMWGYLGSVEETLPPTTTTGVQLASAFTSRLTPAGLGGLGLNILYFENRGISRQRALGAVGLNQAAGAVVHAAGVFFALAFLGTSGIGGVEVPTSWPVLVAVVIGMALAGAFLWSPFGRRRVLKPVAAIAKDLVRVVRQPTRALALFGGSAAVTMSNAFCLLASLAAFDADIPVGQVLAVYIGGSAIAASAPTPGALGAVEAALVAGLTGIGIGATPAVASVLTFRLLSFWLPILPGLFMFRYLQHRKIV